MENRDRVHWEKWISDHAITILIVILAISIIALVLVVAAYATNFHSIPISNKTDEWGQFGDFLGGTLNPVFGFLSVMALLTALVIQSRELKNSYEELQKSTEALQSQHKAIDHQSFEQTFFAWMKTYRELLDSVEITIFRRDQPIDIRGRKVLNYWWNDVLSESFVLVKLKSQGLLAEGEENRFQQLRSSKAEHCISASKVIMKKWNDDIYKEHEFQLDSLFRVLYRLILWIDRYPEDRLNSEGKWIYVSIIRAQLSWIELVYLFYNGQTERGMKFKELSEKYALFDNLAFDSDPVIQFLRDFPPDNLGYSSAAYDSDEARKLSKLS